jgi:hypothetical protein
MGGYPSDIKFQNSEFAVLSLPKLPKLPSDLFFGEICLRKLKILPFLDGICMEGCQNSKFRVFFRLLDPNIGKKMSSEVF